MSYLLNLYLNYELILSEYSRPVLDQESPITKSQWLSPELWEGKLRQNAEIRRQRCVQLRVGLVKYEQKTAASGIP